MIGQRVSHYNIVSKIGQGGMGVVYKAEDTKLNRPVAMKFLPAGAFEESDKVRFLNEAKTAARLHHPNICPIYEVDEADGQLFFVMAYLEGQPLGNVLRNQPMETNQALALAIQIAGGLEEARRQGVVHRDIKPANIIVNPQGHAYIVDFGLALAGGSSRLTVPGSVMGTPSYMSPEQARGRPVDNRADVWALGVVLFEMLSGKRPFDRDHSQSVLFSIVNDPPPPLGSLRPGLPAGLAEVVEKALAKNPDQRWRTAGEMAGELRFIKDGNPNSAPLNNPTITIAAVAVPEVAPDPGPKSRSRKFAAGAAALAALAAAAAWYQFAGPELPREKNLAVLPFSVIGSDQSVLPIVDGLVETLTSRLGEAAEPQWKILVIPSSEIRSRKINSAEDAKRIYGANLAVTGSAQKVDEKVRFHMNLVDTATMRQAGARSFDYDARKPFGVGDDALNGLLSLLQVRFSKAAQRPSSTGETSNPEAYASYLKGRGYYARFDIGDNVDRAIESLLDATRADPKYSLAFAALGEAYWRKALVTSDKTWAEQARAAAQRAVELDPNLAVAHAKLGDIQAQSGSREAAIQELRTAMKLDPGNADAHRALASLYANMGRFPEAEKSFIEVTQRRPSDWLSYFQLGVFYWSQNRYAEAETALGRSRELTPDNEAVSRNLGGLYVIEGRYSDARRELKRAIELKKSARGYSVLGVAEYYDRHFKESAAALEEAVRLDSNFYIGFGNLGSAYRQMQGAKDKATLAFTRAIELGQKRLELTPHDYSIHANLAEYKAKLGDSAGSLAEINQIPPDKRAEFWGRLVLAYELTGHRAEAVRWIENAVAKTGLPHEVKDDPELASLLSDPSLKHLVESRKR